MYVRYAFAGIDRIYCLWFLWFQVWALCGFMQEVAWQNTAGSISLCKECTSEFYRILDKDMPRGRTRGVHWLEGEKPQGFRTPWRSNCAEEGTEGRQNVWGSIELCQEGIERVQWVHRRNSISSSGKKKPLKFCESLPRGHWEIA